MTPQETLIDWIHRVQTKIEGENHKVGKKRLPGLIMELFFENWLSGTAGTSCPSNLSFGWALGYTDFSKTQRRWFKISEGHQTSNVIGCKFVRRILSLNPSDEFYLLQPEVSLPDSLPSITWNVGQIFLTEDHRLKHARTAEAKTLETQLSASTNNALKSRLELHAIDKVSSWC